MGPKPRDYRYSLNKKVKKLAMLSALSSKVKDGDMIVLDNISVEEYKTKTIVNMLKALGADKKAMIVMPSVDDKLIQSASNIPGVQTALVNTINVYDILNHDKFIIVKSAVENLRRCTHNEKGTGHYPPPCYYRGLHVRYCEQKVYLQGCE